MTVTKRSEMNPPIKKVAFTAYPVTDMKRARAFYEDILGLAPGENFHGAFQEYDLGGTTFAIDSSPLSPTPQNSVALEIAELSTWVKRLQERGVQFRKLNEQGEVVMETPVCWMALMHDPDGNTLALHQAKI